MMRRALGPLLCLTLAVACSSDAPEEIHFRFAPADGTSFDQRMTVDRTQERSGKPALVEQSRSSARFSIARAPAGYTVTVTSLESSVTRDDQLLDDPVSKLLQDKPVIYDLDPAGRPLAVRGFEGLAERAAAGLPPELARQLAGFLTEERLVERAKQEWERRFSSLAGKTVRIGELWSELDQTEIPGGQELTTYRVVWFPSMAACDGGSKRCARIRVFEDSQLENLRATLAPWLGERSASLFSDARPSEQALDAMSSEVDRLVEPETLMPREETELRVIRRTLSGPEGTPVTLLVTQRKTYELELVK